jgi:Putative peptidoglycan binding domain/Transglycosylase SLT domain
MAKPTLRLNDGYKHTSPKLKNDVKELQRLLKQNGFTVKIDGLFGADTEKAVLKYQKDNKLKEDGIVGRDTWSALLNTEPPDEKTFIETIFPSNTKTLKEQLTEAEKYRGFIEASAKKYKFQSCIICGIGSRESSWGLSLKPHGPSGTGDFIKRKFPATYRNSALPPDGGGFGRGLMQVDFDAHEFARTGNWKDAESNIEYGCKVLSQSYSYLKKNTNLKDKKLLQAAIAGYNCGPGNVLKAVNAGLDVDYYTFGRDYSKDVLNRAGWFQMTGWV